MKRLLSILTLLSGLLAGPAADLAPIRCLHVDLNARPRQSNSPPIASVITNVLPGIRVANPDLVFVQGLRDWKMAASLARGLGSNFQVAVCSSFSEPARKGPGNSQIAILSRHKPYFSWTQPWMSGTNRSPTGGYAFAAFDVRGARIGCFTVSARAPAGATNSAGAEPGSDPRASQLLHQVSMVRQWSKNKLDLFLVEGLVQPPRNAKPGQDPDLIKQCAAVGLVPVKLQGAPANTWLLIWPDGASGPAQGNPDAPSGLSLVTFELAPGSGFPVQPPPVKQSDSRKAADIPGPSKPRTTSPATNKPLTHVTNAAEAIISQGPPAPEPGLIPATSAEVPPGSSGKARPKEMVTYPKNAENQRLGSYWLWIWGAFGVAFLGLLIGFTLRGTRQAQRRPKTSMVASTYMVVSPKSVTTSIEYQPAVNSGPLVQVEPSPLGDLTRGAGLPAHQSALGLSSQDPLLLFWIKRLLSRKLLTDRSDLLMTQALAIQKTERLETHLRRIETLIAEQDRKYQEQIDALNRELTVAREESRTLLKARIAQLKAEMEAGRTRLTASAQTGPS